MPMRLFLQSGSVDAKAEFETFKAAHRSVAIDQYTLLVTIRSVGLNMIPNHHVTIGLKRHRCIQTAGWATFYIATGAQWKKTQDPTPVVCVVMVEQMVRAFADISRDAQARVAAARL